LEGINLAFKNAVKFEFGGRERSLALRPSSLRDFENMMDGKTLSELLPGRGMNTLAALLWAGLKHEDDKISMKKVFGYLDDYIDAGGDLLQLWDVVGKALINSGIFGAVEPEGKEAQTPTAS
jgi:hypothetical protein